MIEPNAVLIMSLALVVTYLGMRWLFGTGPIGEPRFIDRPGTKADEAATEPLPTLATVAAAGQWQPTGDPGRWTFGFGSDLSVGTPGLVAVDWGHSVGAFTAITTNRTPTPEDISSSFAEARETERAFRAEQLRRQTELWQRGNSVAPGWLDDQGDNASSSGGGKGRRRRAAAKKAAVIPSIASQPRQYRRLRTSQG